MLGKWGARSSPRSFLIIASFVAAACATGGIRIDRDIEFEGPDGKKVWKLEVDPEKVELEDAYSRDLHVFRYQRGLIVFEDASGQRLEVVGRDGQLVVRSGNAGRTFYRFQREPDGDYRLEDSNNTAIYHIKQRAYGVKVVGRGGGEFKVRRKQGKISIRKASGTTILSTRDPISPLAASCFSLDGLPVATQAALALGVMHWKLDANGNTNAATNEGTNEPRP